MLFPVRFFEVATAAFLWVAWRCCLLLYVGLGLSSWFGLVGSFVGRWTRGGLGEEVKSDGASGAGEISAGWRRV